MTSFGEIMASETMVECGKSLIILGLLMICNILLGTINSLAVDKIKFDKVRMINGISKATGIAIGAFTLAYAFDQFDLSNIGYNHMTILSTAIFIYAIKCMKNIVKALGLEKDVNLPEVQAPNQFVNSDIDGTIDNYDDEAVG